MARRIRKGIPDMGELNLAPIMNLMVTLIPMLLLSASFLEIVLIDTSLPVFSSVEEMEQKEEKEEKPKLGLTVAITETGFVIGGQGGILGSDGEKPSIPRLSDNSYDFITLSQKLYDIKQRFPDEWSVIIVPESTTKFSDIVSTMDATREYFSISPSGEQVIKTMFPNVVIGGGII